MIDNTKKNFFWNTIGSAFLSFNSLFYLIIVTRINGIEDAGIFSFAYASSCIINTVALFCGRTYQVTDDNKEITESSYVVMRLITAFAGTLIAVVFVLINGYAIFKSGIFILLCLLKCIEAISDIFYGILQKRDKLYVAGKAMTYKSVTGLLVFIFTDLLFDSLWISCILLVMFNVFFLLLYEIKYAKRELYIEYSFKKEEIKLLIKKAMHTFLFTLIIVVIVNVPRYIIDIYLNSDAQAIYGIISMPATFVMLLGQFILQPSLVKITNSFRQKEQKEFNKIILKLILCILGSLLFIVPAAYFLGIPVLNIIYGVQLETYRNSLILVIVGSAFYAASNVLLNALITIRCTKPQFYLQIFILIVSIFISMVTVKKLGIIGSIYSYSFILVMQFIAYSFLYAYKIKKSFK